MIDGGRGPDRTVTKPGAYIAVELWFKTTGRGVLASYQNKMPPTNALLYTPLMYIDTSGRLRAKLWSDATTTTTITTPAAVNNGQWHHAVLSGAGATQTLYLDGAEVGHLGGAIDVPRQNITLLGNGYVTSWPAAKSGGGYDPYTGDIDEVAVYDRPLGLVDVREHYRARHAASQLTSVTNPSGRRHATVAYDVPTDRVSQLTDRNGGVWQVGEPVYTGTAEAPVSTVTVTDPGTNPIVAVFDPLRGGRMTKLTSQGGGVTRFDYDVPSPIGSEILVDVPANPEDLRAGLPPPASSAPAQGSPPPGSASSPSMVASIP
jgi:hypothetical protein